MYPDFSGYILLLHKSLLFFLYALFTLIQKIKNKWVILIMFLLDRRYFRYFDWAGFFLMSLIAGLGLLFVFSATYKPEMPYSLFFKKQLFGICSGLLIYFVCSTQDYRYLMRWGYFLYFGVLGLLVFTIIKGSIGMGAQRWIDLGIVKAQPSELAKLLFPAFVAYYFQTQKDHFKHTFKDFIPMLAILGISALLIRKQPDLGTALILTFSGIFMFWFAGINKKFFLGLILISIIGAPLMWNFGLKDYQKKRIEVFLGEGDMRKERYQIEQSKIAIGSGGFFGKGYLQGTQNKLHFLPESRTDFIFSVLCEEWGFLGALLVLALYTCLFIHFFMIIKTIAAPHVQLLAFGLIIHIVISALINISMVLGLLPVVGIPLPLISYGVSSLWVTFASLGWFNNIAIRRFYMGE